VGPPREPALVLRGHTGKITALAFSRDGTRLLTAADDPYPRLWDPATGREVLRFGADFDLGPITSARFSSDETKVVTASQVTYSSVGKKLNSSSVHVWDAKTGAELLALADHRHAALDARLSDGKTIFTVSSGGTNVKGGLSYHSNGQPGLARLWDAGSGKLLATLEHTAPNPGSWWSAPQLFARLSPDGKLVLHRPPEGDAFLLADAVTGKTKARLVHPRAPWGMPAYVAAISPDSRRIFTATGSRDARVWDVASARTIVQIDDLPAPARFAAFSSDGRRLAVVMGRFVYIWDLQTGERLAVLEGHEGDVVRVAFSPDGKQIVTGGRDQQALLWDAATGKTLALFTGHSGAVTHVAFSPTGTQVATGSEDGTIRIWPADLAAAVRQRLPRQLHPAERQRYAIDGQGEGADNRARFARPKVRVGP
jgi:WD40 repeat protein